MNSLGISKKELKFWCVILIICIWSTSGILVHASQETGELFSVLKTKAFKGDWAFFSNLNFIGYFMQALISIVSLGMICGRVITIMISLFYLSLKNIFDQVHEIKEAGNGDRSGVKGLMLGMDLAFKKAASVGTGVDAFIFMVLSLLPDIIIYSDYKPGAEMKSLDKDKDTPAIYVAKIFLPSVLHFLVAGMGFVGSLWGCFVTVADAGLVIVNEVVEFELDHYVSEFLNRDGRFEFNFDAAGTTYSKLRQNIAEELYKDIIKEIKPQEYKDRQGIGIRVNEYVTHLFPEKMEDSAILKSITTFIMNNDDIKNLEYDINVVPYGDIPGAKESKDLQSMLNGEGYLTNSKNKFTINLDANQQYTNNKLTINIFVKRKNVKPEVNYFKKEEDTSTKTGTSGGVLNVLEPTP